MERKKMATNTARAGLTPAQKPLGIQELRAIASACARQFARDYNDQQDLTSQAILAVLQYGKPVLYPKQFLRTTVRNLAIGSARARERHGHEHALDAATESRNHTDPCRSLIVSDALGRLEMALTPSELRCYRLLCQGFERRDLPRLLNISRQAVSQILQSIRKKYADADRGTDASDEFPDLILSKGVGATS